MPQSFKWVPLYSFTKMFPSLSSKALSVALCEYSHPRYPQALCLYVYSNVFHQGYQVDHSLQILFYPPISEMSIHYYWWSRYYHLIYRHFAYFILVLSPSAPRKQDPLSIIHLIGVISMPSSAYLCQWVLDSLSPKISLVILLKHLCYCRRTQILPWGFGHDGTLENLGFFKKNWVESQW